MTNPYGALDMSKFWKKAVVETYRAQGPGGVHPRAGKRLILTEQSRIATAGSCFAQNVAKHLRAQQRVQVIEAEPLRAEDPVFSGRYGNIYTARQLRQLIEEVDDGRPDPDCAVRRREDGRWVDLLRPYMEPEGFDDPAAVIAARADHLAAIAAVFTEPDVFVFTLGLTEGWEDPETGRVYPICPGVYSDEAPDSVFHNFTYEEVMADMQAVLAALRARNPGVRLLLTVSPVPLTATYGRDDVMTATMLSKSVLRAVCGALEAREPDVFYFPSYEMIANPFTPGTAYADNLRTVEPEAIAGVMKRFEADYCGQAARETPAQATAGTGEAGLRVRAAVPPADDVICDDLQIESSMGF